MSPRSAILYARAKMIRSLRAGLDERGFIEVLDAQRTLRLVRSDYNQARFDRFTAWLDIDRLRAKNPFEVK